MEKNQTTCPKAVCEKIFKAITFAPAFSTIRRISSRRHTPSPVKHPRNPSLPNSDPPIRPLDIKPKLTSPQRPKPTSAEGSEVPINFDYTTRSPTPPTESPKPIALNGSIQNINGQVPHACTAQQAKAPKPSTDMVQSGKPTVPGNGQQVSGVASRTEPGTSVLSAESKPKHKSENSKGQIQVQIERRQANREEEGKKPTHYDDTFTAYISRAKKRITSHDQEYGENSSKVLGHNHGHGHRGTGKDHHFSDYIDRTKRTIRTTSSIKDKSESFFK
ncbi:hypothetical protein QQP08_000212 [Theobroma cacao]|nr:hypothetical protein QQP08_000212 [Theobroma cacao]